jgi:hypothetical protein
MNVQVEAAAAAAVVVEMILMIAVVEVEHDITFDGREKLLYGIG